jgi:Ca-activated chloride channel family protein
MLYRRSLLVAVVFGLATFPPFVAYVQQPDKKTDYRPQQKSDDKVKIRTDVVNLTVKVSDTAGRFVMGLNKEDFEVYDNGVKQEIAFFSDEDDPISLGFVYDISGSMAGFSSQQLSMLRRFFDHSHQQDEYFIMTFNNKPKLIQDFTSSPEEIVNRVYYLPAKGSTSLYDAAYLATEKVRQGRHHKKALIIFSDGMENSSRYSGKELRNLLKETNVQIYTIGFGDGGVLKDIAEATDGLAGFPYDYATAEHFYTRLALLLRKQYVIGFYPTDTSGKDSWHKVQVKVKAPRQMGRLILSFRKGYPSFQ